MCQGARAPGSYTQTEPIVKRLHLYAHGAYTSRNLGGSWLADVKGVTSCVECTRCSTFLHGQRRRARRRPRGRVTWLEVKPTHIRRHDEVVSAVVHQSDSIFQEETLAASFAAERWQQTCCTNECCSSNGGTQTAMVGLGADNVSSDQVHCERNPGSSCQTCL